MLDANKGEPLPYVHVISPVSNTGVTTELDGTFRISNPGGLEELKFSYVGYQQKTISLEDHHNREKNKISDLTVHLESKAVGFREFEVTPGTNPAKPIIREVIANRHKHNPENLSSFQYEAYKNAVITNSLARGEHPNIEELLEDTTTQEAAEFLSNHHFFMMESVSERKFLNPSRDEEQVKALRASVFERPYFLETFMSMGVENLYENQISFMGNNYHSPIGNQALDQYYFTLKDTLYDNPKDTTWLISFEPARKSPKTLKGTVFINNEDKALSKVLIERGGTDHQMEFFLRQTYKKHGDSIWFPEKAFFELKPGRKTDIDLELIMDGFDADIVLTGKSSIQNPKFNPLIPQESFSRYGYHVPEEAYERGEEFWQKYRDSLSKKEDNTYSFMDSLGREHEFDKYLYGAGNLLTEGYLPWKFLNFELGKLLRINRYEGFRPGLGFHTNHRLSNTIKPGGYFAYGLGDNNWKYGANLNIRLHDYTDTWLEVSYANDAHRPGLEGFDLVSERDLIDNFLRATAGKFAEDYERYRMAFTTRGWQFANVGAFLNKERRSARGDYLFTGNDEPSGVSNYRFTEAGLTLRYGFGEELIRTGDMIFNRPSPYPVVKLKYQQGIDGLLGGRFDYERFSFEVFQKTNRLRLGETRWSLKGGIITNSAPVGRLFTGTGSLTENGYYRYFIPGAFQTARVNEFLHDKEVTFNLTQDLYRLQVDSEYINPVLSYWSHLGWGTLSNPEHHKAFSTSIMDEIFIEQGLTINKLYREMGVGVFYRLGPHAHESFEDNFRIKATYRRDMSSFF